MVKTSQEFKRIGFAVTMITVDAAETSFSSNATCGWVVLWCSAVLLFSSVFSLYAGCQPSSCTCGSDGVSLHTVTLLQLSGAVITRRKLEGNALITCDNAIRSHSPLHNKSIILLCFSTPSKILAIRSVSHIPLIA